MSEVFVLLGGNLGNKHKIFSETLEKIQNEIGKVSAISSCYETEPWGFVSDLFWNQAVKVNTVLEPEALLNGLQSIEKYMGRQRIAADYEARPMDLDILFYDERTIETDRLSIPHPLISLRKFVLVPLNEIAPDKIHPQLGLSVHEMLQRCPDKLKVVKVNF